METPKLGVASAIMQKREYSKPVDPLRVNAFLYITWMPRRVLEFTWYPKCLLILSWLKFIKTLLKNFTLATGIREIFLTPFFLKQYTIWISLLVINLSWLGVSFMVLLKKYNVWGHSQFTLTWWLSILKTINFGFVNVDISQTSTVNISQPHAVECKK